MMMKSLQRLPLFALLMILILVGCQDNTSDDSGSIRGEIMVDGSTRTFSSNQSISVQELLRQENIIVGDIDRITPSRLAPITDGMTITIVRVREETECTEEILPFEEQRIARTDLEPGEERIAEQGENGLINVCYSIIYEDDVEKSRNRQRETVLEEPQDAIIFYGANDSLDPVSIDGSIVYISGTQAWIMQTSNAARRPLNIPGPLDGRVFELSSDQDLLLYTKLTDTEDDPDFSNELWLVTDLFSGSAVQLDQVDILSGEWLPKQPNTFSYTTAAAGGGFSGWNALNDMYVVTVDPLSGTPTNIEVIIEQNLLGQFASWGTVFEWAPDGDQLAYAKADGVGLVIENSDDFRDYLIRFPHFNTAIANDWVWQPDISWSDDGQWMITTVHGPPFGSEDPVDSVVFNVAILRLDQTEDDEEDDTLVIDKFIDQAGIWSFPTFSPTLPDGSFRIAYLQARAPQNSIGTQYDLIVMDRDGSNKEVLFPRENDAGIRPSVGFDGTYVWSPDGQKIAMIYQGNIWMIDVTSGLIQQLTNDGGVSTLRWVG